MGVMSDLNWFRDAAIINVTNLRYMWDGPNTASFLQTLQGTAYSYLGDFVCQNGYVLGVACGIKVTDGDISYSLDGRTVRGVRGDQVNSGQHAVCGGDSGGLVFAIAAPSTRQVRGIVSAGNANSSCSRYMLWTEALDIYPIWGLRLNE